MLLIRSSIVVRHSFRSMQSIQSMRRCLSLDTQDDNNNNNKETLELEADVVEKRWQRLRFASVLPLAGFAAAVCSVPMFDPMAGTLMFAQLTYAQTLLALNCGVQLSKALATPRLGSAASASLAALLGWASTMLPPEFGSAALMCAFAVVSMVDMSLRQGSSSYFIYMLAAIASLAVPFLKYF
jgi:hypothetical protein